MEASANYPQNLSCRKVFAFLEEGILAKDESRKEVGEKYDFPISGSNDQKNNEKKITRVCVNSINQMTNIGPSLYNSANGGFAVIVEDREVDKGLTQQFLEQNKGKIESIISEKQKLLPIGHDMLLSVAIKEVASGDKEFKKTIVEKIHYTALFILNIPLKDNVIEAHINKNISPDKIEKVLLPKDMEKFMEVEKDYFEKYTDKIVYVDDRNLSFQYGYELNNNAISQLRNTVQIEIENVDGPDYESELKNEIGKLTHMTSLFFSEEK